MGRLRGASFPILALITLLLGAVLLIAAFASPYWFHNEHSYKGLWVNLRCKDISAGLECHRWPIKSQVEGWFSAVRGLLVAGLALMLIVLVCIPAYIHAGRGLSYRTTMLTLAVLSFVSAACTILGSIIFGFMWKKENEDWNYSWCFFIGIVGGGLALISALILIVAACFKVPREDHKYKKFPDLYIDPYKPTVYTLAVE